MKVNNKKALSRLSLRSLLASKKQNFITVLAILLTTVLFTSLFTVFFSLKGTLQLQQCKEYGNSSYAMVYAADEDIADRLQGIADVENVGRMITLGITDDRLNVAWMDDMAAEMSFSKPESGRLPESSYEVVVSSDYLKSIGGGDIGSQITIDYKVVGLASSCDMSETFTVCGISGGDSRYVLVSEDYADDMFTSMGEETLQFSNVVFDLKAPSELRAYSIADEIGVDARTIMVNPAYSSESDPLGTEGYVAIAVLMLLIFFTGFLIIYNIFQITVANKVRDYGLLKTIGVTSKQIRKIIRKQSLLLCLIGVPAGLILGYLIGVSMLPMVLSQTIYKSIEPVSGFNIFVFAAAALISVITVFVSSSVPGRKASRVSPIEALRYNEVKVSLRKKKKVNASIPSMAMSNLGRNKVRTALVVLSISLAMVLFDTLCIFVDNMDMNSYIQSMASSMDFTVSTPSYFTGDHDEFLSAAEIEEIASHIDSDYYGYAYTTDNAEAFVNADIEYTAQLVGVDTVLFDEVNVVEGDISSMYETGKDTVVVTEASELHPGDKVNVTLAEDFHYKDTSTGKVYDSVYDIPDNMDFSRIEYIIEGIDREYTVCAVMDEYPTSYTPGFMYGGRTAQILMTKDQIADITSDDYAVMCYCADAVSSDAAAEAEAYLQELCEGDPSRYEYSSIETVRKDFEKFTGAIRYIGGFLCVIIGIIAVLNYINAVLTGILARKRELALLKAVGMTGRQLKRMLMTEGLFYALISVLFSMPFAIAANLLFLKIDLFWSAATAHITVVPILILMPVLAVIGAIIPNVLYSNIKGRSIVEDLRTNE
ncbi:MAG: FtsX-like permease family protein [Clostridiales bacterium]|nr:FtsX-like permease family protein [Clostridiales bacterium]